MSKLLTNKIAGAAFLAVMGMCASPVFAQSGNLTFSYQGSSDPTPVAISAGDTIFFPPTNAGSSAIVSLLIRNNGSASVTVTGAVGSGSAFSLLSSAPVTVAANSTGVLAIRFAPPSTGAIGDSLALTSTAGDSVTFALSGGGTSQNFVASYILPNGNQTQIANGGTLSIPDTLVGGSTTLTIVVQNRGTGVGVVNSVSVGNNLFQISGLPLFPSNLAPNAELRFTLAFVPAARGLITSNLQIGLAGGFNFALSARGIAPIYTIENITATPAVPVGSTLTFPSVQVGQSATLTLRVKNDGDAAGKINAISIIGSGFFLTNLVPPPVTLPLGSSITFNVVFTPTVIGDATAQLLLDNLATNLKGTALGANLSLAFKVGSVVTQIPNSGTLLFPNIAVGTNTSATLTVTNTGNVSTAVTSVSASGAAFSVTSAALPINIGPGQGVDFSLRFAPTLVGANTGTLVIDNIVLSLRGIGVTPTALPNYSFTGDTNAAGPLLQPALGLRLASAYPLDLAGRLTITFTTTSFVDDPTIQFAQGGRTVNFVIPANTTDAVFGQSKQVQFQTGSVSGTITITPSFTIGGVDVTPASPLLQTVLISPAAPQLQTLRVGARTANSFELLITGYSTPRELSQMVLQFTAASGRQLQGDVLTVNVSTPFSTWYQSPSSNSSGSQFTASLVIQVNGDAGAVASASVTASNSRGNSAPVSASLQ